MNWNEIYKKEMESPYKPRDGDNFDSAYCNRVDPIDRNTYDYFVHKINNENYFVQFYFNYTDINRRELFFELDGLQYKFINPNEDKNETSKHMKNTTATNTPRLYETGTFSPGCNLSFSQSIMPSSRKLVYK
jgi:hypothetical protein